MRRSRLPEVVVKRLPVYLRSLEELRHEDVVSSAQLAQRTGFSSEQIRKDFALLDLRGTRGVGYRTRRLRERLRQILGLEKPVPVAVVGAGNLGTALTRYANQRPRDVYVRALFDVDPDKVGATIAGVQVRALKDMPRVLQTEGIAMAVIAVPARAARRVAAALMDAGVTVMLNFSPVPLEGAGRAYIRDIDLSLELQSLTYYLSRSEEASGEQP